MPTDESVEYVAILYTCTVNMWIICFRLITNYRAKMPSLSLFISCQNGLKSLWCDLTSNPYKNFCTASALQTQNILGKCPRILMKGFMHALKPWKVLISWALEKSLKNPKSDKVLENYTKIEIMKLSSVTSKYVKTF